MEKRLSLSCKASVKSSKSVAEINLTEEKCFTNREFMVYYIETTCKNWVSY